MELFLLLPDLIKKLILQNVFNFVWDLGTNIWVCPYVRKFVENFDKCTLHTAYSLLVICYLLCVSSNVLLVKCYILLMNFGTMSNKQRLEKAFTQTQFVHMLWVVCVTVSCLPLFLAFEDVWCLGIYFFGNNFFRESFYSNTIMSG